MTSLKRHKWHNYRILKRSEELAPHMPKTRRFTQKHFFNFIDKYSRIIVKPVGGSRGYGVFKVSPVGHHYYKIHIEKKRRTKYGRKQAYQYIKRKIGSRRYMVQRYIPLAKVNNRPFDIRVIVQRRKHSSSWKVTAMVAKVAGPGYIVTNLTRSNGTALHVKTAIKHSTLRYYSADSLVATIKSVALKCAKRLSKYFPHHRIYGLDMGLDQDGRVWIIEANLYPAMSHFRKLKDPAMYRRIKAYKRG